MPDIPAFPRLVSWAPQRHSSVNLFLREPLGIGEVMKTSVAVVRVLLTGMIPEGNPAIGNKNLSGNVAGSAGGQKDGQQSYLPWVAKRPRGI